MINFLDWLEQQRRREDPVGALAGTWHALADVCGVLCVVECKVRMEAP